MRYLGVFPNERDIADVILPQVSAVLAAPFSSLRDATAVPALDDAVHACTLLFQRGAFSQWSALMYALTRVWYLLYSALSALRCKKTSQAHLLPTTALSRRC
jgi:hypothetical protein